LIELSARDRAKVDDAVARIVEASGSGLIAVALYGEAASPEYHAGRSPLSLVALVKEVKPAILSALRPVATRFRRRRIPTPLIVDPDYLDRARDVFPLELLEIRERHCILAGDSEALARIEVDIVSLRREVEAEIRGKLLHLWEDYLTARSRRRLRTDILDSVPYFTHILRGMLHLRSAGAAIPIVPAVEREYGLVLPVLVRLEEVHRERRRIPLRELDTLFAAYLDEARALARAADRL
jgi:hypothetical protein